MLDFITSFFPKDVREEVVVLGVMLGYLCLCIIYNRVHQRHLTSNAADGEAVPRVPDLHPALLGALWFHKDTSSTKGANALSTALGCVVRLIGQGTVSFSERRSEAVDSGSVVSERLPERSSTEDELVRTYGEHLWLEARETEGLDELDTGALELVMPAGRTSINQLCHSPEERQDLYRQLKRYLPDLHYDLEAAGLARATGPLAHLVFGPGTVVCVILCIIGPAALLSNPSYEWSPLSVVAAMAVIICRAALVDLGPTITPEGASVLARAQGTVHWAKGLGKGVSNPSALSEEDVPGVLATLITVGRYDLAASLAAQIADPATESAAGPSRGAGDQSPVQQALLLCRLRPYISTSFMRRDVSPAGLAIEQVGKYCEAREGD